MGGNLEKAIEQEYGIAKIEVPLTRVHTISRKVLELFKSPGKGYDVQIEFPEFTCLCPKTHQPDFAILTISYRPHEWCVELKALKYYLNSFRNEGHFHEEVTNLVYEDLKFVLFSGDKDSPRCGSCGRVPLRVVGEFNVRGGTYPTIGVGCSHI